MIFRDRRFATSAALAALLAAGASLLSAQTAPGRETSAASVASYGLDQSMPADPDVLIGGLPNGLRYYVRANAAAPRRTAAGRQGRIRARGRRPAGVRSFRRTHGVRRDAPLSRAGHRPVPGIAGVEHRPGRERRDQLRRHAVHAAGADRRAGGAR